MLTDPVADMLTRIRNANKALHETAEMPSSKLIPVRGVMRTKCEYPTCSSRFSPASAAR